MAALLGQARPGQTETIGDRIRTRRKLRGLSVRALAELAGVSPSTLSRIETGQRGADNRLMIAAIARALQCATTDLTGLPPVPQDRAEAETEAMVYETVQALIETDLDEAPTTRSPRPLPQLGAEIERIYHLRNDCEYAHAARLLPPLLRDLHAHVHGHDHETALRLFARATDHTSFVVRYLGHATESWLAAERCRDAARALGEPVILGLAAWSRAHAASSCGAYERSLRITESGIEVVRDAVGEGAQEMRGQLYMMAAWTQHVLVHPDDAAGWLERATNIARDTGQTQTLGLNFGPAGISIWRVSMATEAGDAGKAVEIAGQFSPADVPAKSRQSAFYLDIGRALAELGRDERAVKMILQAERLGTERIQRSPLAAETVRSIAGRLPPGTEIPGLAGLAERLGVSSHPTRV